MTGTWGGKRPGAGRKPRTAEATPEKAGDRKPTRDPLEYLLDVMQGLVTPTVDQLKAAIAATQYVHTKKGEGGKKDAAKEAAQEVATGRFKSKPPPLRAVK
jgi:phage terminase small subunit